MSETHSRKVHIQNFKRGGEAPSLLPSDGDDALLVSEFRRERWYICSPLVAGQSDSRLFMDHFNDMQRQYTSRLIQEGQWIERKRGPPIVVHCSAGVGRTGTLCALDVIAERLWKTRDRPGGPLVSIGQTVKIMRTQRHKAVQRPEQYLFLYLGVVESALKNHLVDPEKVDLSAIMTKKITPICLSCLSQ